MADTLLIVSGTIPENLEELVLAGKRPRADYQALAAALPADLMDYRKMRASNRLSTRIINKLAGPNAAMAWECFMLRDKYSVIFTDGEQVGIPFAVFLKFFGRGKNHIRHAMIVHILSVPQKMLFFDLLEIHDAIDRYFVYATFQRNFIMERWNEPGEKVIWIPFMADGRFFHPLEGKDQPAVNESPMICSAGLEFRDYPTLMGAVEGMDVSVVLAAASPWSKRSDSTQQRSVPPNVTVQRFSQYDLRDLYDKSKFVVVPLCPVNFQAGVTTIMEAMAMGKAVIVSRTPGQTDYIEDGVTGIYVPPGDSAALKSAIIQLLENPAETARLGKNALEKFRKDFDLDRYVALIKEVIDILKK